MSNDDDRLLTKAEKQWCTRLLRCLNAMPPNIEISVLYCGSVDVRNNGAGERYVDLHGDRDVGNSLITLLPKTRRRIDGRDSVI